jgi:hypothetical protein
MAKEKKEDVVAVRTTSAMKEELTKLAINEGFDDLSSFLIHDWNKKLKAKKKD